MLWLIFKSPSNCDIIAIFNIIAFYAFASNQSETHHTYRLEGWEVFGLMVDLMVWMLEALTVSGSMHSHKFFLGRKRDAYLAF